MRGRRLRLRVTGLPAKGCIPYDACRIFLGISDFNSIYIPDSIVEVVHVAQHHIATFEFHDMRQTWAHLG